MFAFCMKKKDLLSITLARLLNSYCETFRRKCPFSCLRLAARVAEVQRAASSALPQTALNVKNREEKTPGAFRTSKPDRDRHKLRARERACMYVCARARARSNRASLRGWEAWRPHTLRIAPLLSPTHTHTHSLTRPLFFSQSNKHLS